MDLGIPQKSSSSTSTDVIDFDSKEGKELKMIGEKKGQYKYSWDPAANLN